MINLYSSSLLHFVSIFFIILHNTKAVDSAESTGIDSRDTGCHYLRPVIGVLAQKCSGKRTVFGDQYFSASYVKWIESAGARVIPVKINQTDAYYERLFRSINGFLIPGGGQNLLTSGYANAARFFYRRSIRAYDKEGDYFPIWGTCLGFEELLVLSMEERDLDRCYGTRNVALSTKFEPDVKSRLLSAPHGLDQRSKDILKSRNVTSHFHKWGMRKKTFLKHKNITDIFKIVSTANDSRKNEIVDILEGKKYPIYGVQFHPEKNAYEWAARLSKGISHTPDAIWASQAMAIFFVEEARRNCHHFDSQEEEEAEVIYNFKPQEVGRSLNSGFQQCYFFNVTDIDSRSRRSTTAKVVAAGEDGPGYYAYYEYPESISGGASKLPAFLTGSGLAVMVAYMIPNLSY